MELEGGDAPPILHSSASSRSATTTRDGDMAEFALSDQKRRNVMKLYYAIL